MSTCMLIIGDPVTFPLAASAERRHMFSLAARLVKMNRNLVRVFDPSGRFTPDALNTCSLRGSGERLRAFGSCAVHLQ
ncbi:hypothetical protein F2P81_019170 [Scophthalmus maximus]|uniref:Uncharacterized protein n=1 Tax=Scophthalmus maximus TaxID=52904 RepID=A0A6A4S142_SCOMX|nr:hypothetical protein F2P81_019170 [Scophthalmus maximus]